MEYSELGTIILELGRHLLTGSLVLTGAVIALSLLSVLLKERRLVAGARAGFYGLLVLIASASACLATACNSR